MMLNGHIKAPTRTLLIVEDELLNAFVLQKNIGRIGFDIIDIVPDGYAAIEAVRKYSPDIILMDIRLQGKMDGIEAMDQIRLFSDVPVVYTSSILDRESRERAGLTTHSMFISKPVSVQQLQESITYLLNRP